MDNIPWWVIATIAALKYGADYLEIILTHRAKMKEIEHKKGEEE